MEAKVNYALVGLFVILLGSIVFGGAVWLGVSDYGTDSNCYYVYMRESVSGLSIDAPVKYRGVEVGRVKEMKFRPDNPEEVWLTLAIAHDTPVKRDTVATLSLQGLTGVAFVDLAGGSRDAPALQAAPEQPCPVIATTPSLLVRLDEAVFSLLENLEHLSQDIRSLASEDNRTSVQQILADIAQLTHTLAARQELLDAGVMHVARTLEHSERISAMLPGILERIGQSADALRRTAQSISRASTTVNAIVEDSQPTIAQFTHQTLPEIGLFVSELRLLTASLQRLTQQVHREPNSLLFGQQLPPPGPGE